MYHQVVRSKLRRAFEALNAGDYDNVVAQFSERHTHTMHGTHPLGGQRRTLASTQAWYDRLRRLLPGLRFEVQSMAVSGWPWDTRALVSWRDFFTLPDGTPGSNQGVHELRLAWGQVVALEVHCDTEKLQGYCDRMRMLGVTEAAAAPIVD